jgi:hypothetical protein
VSLAIVTLLQQQHVAVGITHHGGVDPVDEGNDPWRDEADGVVASAGVPAARGHPHATR